MMDPRDLCLCWTASLLHPILEFCSSLLKSAGRGARRLAGGDDKQAWQGQVLVQVRLPNSGPKVACQAAAHDWTNSRRCGVCNSQVRFPVKGTHHPPLHPEQPSLAGEEPGEVREEAGQVR